MARVSVCVHFETLSWNLGMTIFRDNLAETLYGSPVGHITLHDLCKIYVFFLGME